MTLVTTHMRLQKMARILLKPRHGFQTTYFRFYKNNKEATNGALSTETKPHTTPLDEVLRSFVTERPLLECHKSSAVVIRLRGGSHVSKNNNNHNNNHRGSNNNNNNNNKKS
jgi:hypothetical protein